MPTTTATRRLAAILVADVVGYSRLMGADEEGTHERVKAHLVELVDPKIREHHGRIVKTTSDGALAEFASVVDAVRCAGEIQRATAGRDLDLAEERRLRFRIGVNLGDVIPDGDDIYGDGVNIAVRLEGLAAPGGICISGTVRDHIGDRLPYAFEDMGEQSVKNIARPVHAYTLRPDGVASLLAPGLPRPSRRGQAVIGTAVVIRSPCGSRSAWQSRLVSTIAAAKTSHIATLQPSATSWRTTSRPIPLPPPVTTAILPSKSFMMSFLPWISSWMATKGLRLPRPGRDIPHDHGHAAAGHDKVRNRYTKADPGHFNVTRCGPSTPQLFGKS
jgi:adenylate cyclase